MSYLGDEDEEEEEAVGVHHALALLRGAAAAEERDEENNGPYKMLIVCGFRLYWRRQHMIYVIVQRKVLIKLDSTKP